MGGGRRFVLESSPLAARRRPGGVADDAKQPGHRIVGWRSLVDQLEEGFLDDVFGRRTPLAGVQHQCRPVSFRQWPEQFRSHHLI